MRPVKRRFRDDLALRNAARANLSADVDFLKADIGRKGIGTRLMETGRRGAGHAGYIADTTVRENKATVTTALTVGLVGFAAYMLRDRIGAAVNDLLGRTPPAEERWNAWAPEPVRKVIDRIEVEIENLKNRIGETR